MNRIAFKRFTQVLSSGLLILTVFAVGYSSKSRVASAQVADPSHPSQTSSYQEDIKFLPESFDAIASKQEGATSDLVTTKHTFIKPIEVDENKGVADPPQETGDESELQDFQATAYSLKGRTASGEYVRPGIIAADPRVLPLGTVVQIKAGRYTGTYTVKDTGGRIKGRKIDIYIPSYKEAKAFGKRKIKIKVIDKSRRKSDPARKTR